MGRQLQLPDVSRAPSVHAPWINSRHACHGHGVAPSDVPSVSALTMAVALGKLSGKSNSENSV